MAGPITHTVLAEKALVDIFADKNSQQFIIGSLFPDIRTLNVIKREATHQKNLTLSDIQNEPDSFRAGFLFHSLIDEVREEVVAKHNAYNGLPDIYLTTVALKVCEDIKMYQYSQNWPTYIKYLETILPQEKEFNIPIEKIKLWHEIHISFFAYSALTDNTQFFMSLGLTEKQITILFDLVNKITISNVIDRYLDDMYSNLQSILESKK